MVVRMDSEHAVLLGHRSSYIRATRLGAHVNVCQRNGVLRVEHRHVQSLPL